MQLLVDTGVVEPDKIELYAYGFHLLVKKAIHTVIILAIGLVVGEFLSVLVFLLTYASIREYSGGYHAKTTAGCYFCTIIVTVNVVFMINMLPEQDSIVIWILLVACSTIIWILSPQEADNKPLKTEERFVYQKKTRRLLTISVLILRLSFVSTAIVKGIACAWIIQVVMLLIIMSRKLVIGR